MKPCCIIGYKYFPANRIEYVIGELCREVLDAVDDGYIHFISGFDGIIELIFAAIVAELKTKNDNLKLEAALAHRGLMNSIDDDFQRLIQQCDLINIHSETYSEQCYQRRNQSIIKQSERVIVVSDNTRGGRNISAMRLAHTSKRDMRIIKI